MTPTPESAIARLEAAEKAMTPGRWRWEEQMLSAGGQTIIWPANAQAEPTDAVEMLGSCGTTAERIEEAEANRDGIALLRNAAPALLAVAQFVVNYVKDDGDDGLEDGGCPVTVTGIHDPRCHVGKAEAVLAALAAAVGEGGA